MRRPRRAVRALLAGTVSVLVAASACSGDDGDDDVDERGMPDLDAPGGTVEPGAPDDGALCWSAEPPRGGDGGDDASGLAFDDATEDRGLVDPLVGMYGHATAAADVDGDGWTDLFVAGFADRDPEDYRHRGADGPSPDRLLRGGPDGFVPDGGFPGELARTSGATFADLDGDGDLDLVVARNPRPEGDVESRPTTVYENGGDTWEAVTTAAPETAARSVAALDVDRDGLVDLAVVGDRFGGGPTTFLRNLGDFAFEDATGAWGAPDDLYGLALATVDLDGDGWLDVVTSGDERVLRGGPDGFTVVQVPALRWETFGDEDDAAGIAVGDIDGDGRPDLAVGQHFNSTVDDGEEVPVRLFLNRSDGDIELTDVTAEAGSPALGTKSPHVDIADVDNDGLADVVTSAATVDGRPLVLHNEGLDGDVPRFEAAGEPGDGMYWVTGVTADLDRDGVVDLFQVSWEPAVASSLFRGTGAAGSWVEVDVRALGPAATGARVEARVGDDVVATAWAASTTGYAAGAPPVVHLGLGAVTGDVELTVTPTGGDPVTLSAPAGSRTALGGC